MIIRIPHDATNELPSPKSDSWVDVSEIGREKFDILVQLERVGALLSIAMRSQGSAAIVTAWLDEKRAGQVVNINDWMWMQYERKYGVARL